MSTLPCAWARYPTPTKSSLRTKPVVTPVTMLFTSARKVPAKASALVLPSRGAKLSTLSSFCISTCGCRSTVRAPFLPLTVTVWPATETSTPLGRLMGFLATRDMIHLSLRDVTQDFATMAGGTRGAVGHQPLRGGDDGDAEAALHLGQFVLAFVFPQARRTSALDVRNDGLAFVIFTVDAQHLFTVVFVLAVAADIAFFEQQLGIGGRHIRRRHGHGRLLRALRGADAGQH